MLFIFFQVLEMHHRVALVDSRHMTESLYDYARSILILFFHIGYQNNNHMFGITGLTSFLWLIFQALFPEPILIG